MMRHGRRCSCEQCRARYTRGGDVYVALAIAMAAAIVMLATSDYAQRAFWALVIQWRS